MTTPEVPDLECIACGHELQNPKFLPCGHEYCGPPKDCLVKLENQEGKVTCPSDNRHPQKLGSYESYIVSCFFHCGSYFCRVLFAPTVRKFICTQKFTHNIATYSEIIQSSKWSALMFARCCEQKTMIMSVSMWPASFHTCVNKKK